MTTTFGRHELAMPIEATKYSHQNIPSGYLRVSITDTCNMKCSYCHNEGQVGVNARNMAIGDLRYIVTNALRYGLVKVRLTGGEPLLHPECHSMLRMLKQELAIPTVGFNTNAILMKTLLPIVSERLIDDLVVGVDYFDGKVSKDSPVGASSDRILKNLEQLKNLGQNVSIACVYDGNCERLERLAAWCLDHEVVLKVLQATDERVEGKVCEDFISMAKRIIERFSLRLGILATFSEYYAMRDGTGTPRIYFFHSHCRVRECIICGKIHIRVTADGFAKSCIQEDVKFPLLTGHFDDSMLKVIDNLGRSPETRRAVPSAVSP
jgi:cyclic pyranopterin phosphate synthase